MTGWYVKFIYAILGKLTSLSLNKVNNKSQGPVPRKMVKFNPGLSKKFQARFSCLQTCNSSLQILLSHYSEIR